MSTFAPERIAEPTTRPPVGAGGRGLGELEAWLRRNRTAATVGGVGLVAGLALLARKRSAATSSTDGATTSTSNTPASYSSTGSGYGASGGAYDSTSSDLYNSIQPQLEALSGRLDVIERGDVIGTTPVDPGTPTTADPAPTPAPTPAPPKAPPPTVTTPKKRAVWQAGDTVWTFASRNGISATQLLTLNSLPQSTRKIAPGTSLRVEL